MNKKGKITLITTAFALVAVIMIGGTLAYFSDRGEATNVVTLGQVDIELTEPKFEALTNNSYTIKDVYPGQKIEKDPTITVERSSSEAYIRAKITYSDQLTQEEQEKLENSLTMKNGWAKSTDGYYYYYDIVKPNESVILFDSVTIPDGWDNSYAEKTFEIDIVAEAIQANNFQPTYSHDKSTVVGWNYTKGDGTIVPITTETYQDNGL